MMTKIKIAISFVLGAIYYWGISYFVLYLQTAENPTLLGIISMAISIFGGLGIIFAIIVFLSDNWKNP